MDSKKKWNRKHSERLHSKDESFANSQLMRVAPILHGGLAIDLACGLGENSFFLAKLNYKVSAFDISEVAVDYVKNEAIKQQLDIDARVCDLNNLSSTLELQVNSIDIVIVTYYLDRLIFPFVKSIIKENGYFFMETFYLSPHNDQQKVSVSDKYKLHPQELLSEFANWHILFYEENEQEGRQTILAKKSGTAGTVLASPTASDP